MSGHVSILLHIQSAMRQFLRRHFLRIAIATTVVIAIVCFLCVWIPYQHDQRVFQQISDVNGVVEFERYDPDWLLTSFHVHLMVFDRIRRVNLRGKQVTDELLRAVGTLQNLEVLDLQNTATTDAGMKHLADLNRLHVLRLELTQVTDEGLKSLQRLTNLQVLHLDKTPITDTGLKNLRGLINLRVLHLNATKIGDRGLTHLEGLHHLKWLSLDNTLVGNGGLPVLKSMPNLNELDLECTRITPAGLDDLKAMRGLESLSLFGTRIHGREREELRSALPNCPQPHATDDRTPRIDQAPVHRKSPARTITVGEDARLGRHQRSLTPKLVDDEVHRGQHKTRR